MIKINFAVVLIKLIDTSLRFNAVCSRYIDYDLSERMKETQADLIVLEGMGRAIHTNFYAPFACDVLKMAVIKNCWLAAQLGGEMYGVVFKYEHACRVLADDVSLPAS